MYANGKYTSHKNVGQPFIEDWEIYIIVLKTEFEVNVVLRIVQHILMKGEH
jgi:hypothetical protein